jgi:hypothetical protein
MRPPSDPRVLVCILAGALEDRPFKLEVRAALWGRE